MKKILALILVLMMLPMTNVFAAEDTPKTDDSTGAVGGTDESGTPHYDSDSEKYSNFEKMKDSEWIDKMGNKELKGQYNAASGDFELTGLLDKLFFEVKDMVPGDSVTKYIRLKNSSKTDYSLSFKANRENEPEEGEVDLFDVLNLEIKEIGKNESEIVYNGKVFEENMKNIVIELGSMKANQDEIYLEATVTMDPNAGNEYQNKEADVKWVFVAEGDKGTNPDKPSNNPSNPNSNNPAVPVNKTFTLQSFASTDYSTVDLVDYSGKGEYKGNVSKTCDGNYIAIYIILACGSLLIGYVLFSKGKKDRKGHEK